MREDSVLTAGDGTPLHLSVWRPDGPPVAAMVLLHGFGEYGGRYEAWASLFAARGVVACMHDQRGHGRTPGPRGVAPNYDAFLDDTALMTDKIRREYPGLPLFLYGHSMGGNVALNYLLKRDQTAFCGAIVTSPWLRLPHEPPRPLVWALSAVSRLYPALSLRTRVRPERLTHEQEIVERVRRDEHYHNTLGVRIAGQIMAAGRYALKHAGEITIPVLLLSGGQDQVVSPLAISVFARSAGANIRHIDFPSLFHEVHNETSRDEVFALEWDFVKKHAAL